MCICDFVVVVVIAIVVVVVVIVIVVVIVVVVSCLHGHCCENLICQFIKKYLTSVEQFVMNFKKVHILLFTCVLTCA
jgi:hypothetical protein